MKDFSPMLDQNGSRRTSRPPSRKLEQLYQIFVEDTATGESIPIMPRMSKEALEPVVEQINLVAIRNPKAWARNARLVPTKSI